MQANLDPERIELMDRYLDKQLNGDELISFEYELEHDPEMFCELEDYRLFRDRLQAYTQAPKKIESFEKQSHFVKKHFVVQSILLVSVSLFVSFALIFSALLLRTNNDLLYSDNYLPLTDAQLNASGSLAVDFINGNYADVVASRQNRSNIPAADKLLLANAYLKLNEPEKAIPLLEDIETGYNNGYNNLSLHNASTYYLAMAYLLNHEEAKALSLFEQIHQDKTHPYHQVAGNWFLLKLKFLVYF